jgi:hypothetical protein
MSLRLQSIENNSENAAPIGHNVGATQTNWAELLDPEGLRYLLGVEHESLLTRKDRLIEMSDNFWLDHPDGILTDADAAAVTDVGAQIKAQAKLVENTRVIVKAPFFQADKAVQAFFLGIHDPLDKAVKTIEAKISKFTRDKAEAARKLAQEQAAAAKVAADRLAAVAIQTESADMLDQAEIVAEEAKQAARVAGAPIAAFSQVRGNYSMSSGSIRYVFEVENIDLVPREWLMINESKVKAAINGKNRIDAIPGLKISEDYKTTIRS